jgi:hypothetical protein
MQQEFAENASQETRLFAISNSTIERIRGCNEIDRGGAIESDCDDYPRSIAVKRFGEGSDCTLFGEGRIQVFGPEGLAFQLEIPRPVQLRR